MPERSKKRPRDPNQLAYQIMLESTGQTEKYEPGSEKKTADPEKNPHAVALGRLGGLKGGNARAEALTPKKRSQIAAKAAATRWGKTATTTKRSPEPLRRPTKPDETKTQYPLQKPAKVPPPPPKKT